MSENEKVLSDFQLEDHGNRYYIEIESGEDDENELFVWPWIGIIANINTQMQGGRRVGESGSKLRDEFRRKGFNPLRVNPLWNCNGHSGFAIVDFKKDWDGFNNAIMFEKEFAVNHCGREDYYKLSPWEKGHSLFGWVARGMDFHSRDIVGDHLRKHGDLKSVSSKQAEDKMKDSKLLTKLNDTLEMKHKHLKEMEIKYSVTTDTLYKQIQEKDAMIRAFNEELKKMQHGARDRFEKISLEHEKARLRLLAQRKELEQQEKELQQREFHNESERRNLHHEKIMNEKAILEQQKADEKIFRLAEEQKEEKEKLRKKILELEKKLDAKQALELEIERMKGALQIMKHMEDDDEDIDIKKKMDAIQEELKDKEEELDNVETINQALIIKERMNNDELQDARKELISGLKEDSHAFIGVKNMGELDVGPFLSATKRKYPDEQAHLKAAELCSVWDDHLRDPSWHPFSVITDKAGTKEIINEDDERVKKLKNELEDEACNAVIQALREINEYNASGRYMVKALWNFKENRKATLKEGVEHLLKQLKLPKRKKTFGTPL